MATNNKNNEYLDKSKIRFSDLVNQTQEYLVRSYNRVRAAFTPASPFGQILQVLQNLTQLIFFYIEDALVELNIYTAFKQRSVYGLARIAGHNPTRVISARGTLKLSIKTDAKQNTQAPFLYLLNDTKIINTNTQLPYIIKVDTITDRVKIDLGINSIYNFRVIQGEIEEQSVISNGKKLQSYNFASNKPIENDNVEVFVNGEPMGLVDSLYDLTRDERGVIVKTGINGGIDIYFGNEDFGYVPPNGAQILVKYINSSGIMGNLYAKSDILTWKFIDKGLSNIGEEVDLNDVFNIGIEKALVLGSNEEEMDFTRLIAPRTSRALVLANPDNYVAFLSRFDYSYVDAYTTFDDNYLDDDNIIYLFLVPNVQSRLSKDTDYFTTPEENFKLTLDEQEALLSYIQKSGRQIVTTELSIVDPIITNYALNIALRVFDGFDFNTLKSDILALLSEYFLRVQRRDKIPKSDIIAMIESVNGVDSVNIEFVSKENEEAITNGYFYKTTYKIDKIRSIKEAIRTKVVLQFDADGNVIEDPQLGLDQFGDIEIGLNQLPIIRGGWSDRNGVFYSTDIKDNNIASVNIIIDEIIDESLANQIMSQNKNILINNERKNS
jgi:hypothetical protein